MKLSVRSKVLSVAGVVVAGALALSACSSSGDSGPSSSGSQSGGKSAPSGSTIKIGAIGSKTGTQASSSNQYATVAPAWAAWVNANGGINGHKVEVKIADDQNDPAKAQSAVKGLVENDHVSAILVGSDGLLPAYSAYVAGKGVPMISGPANSGDWYKQAGTFVTSTGKLSNLNGQLLVAKQTGHAKKVAVLYCSEVSACAESLKLLKPIASEVGLDYTSLAVSSSAPSYTASCLQLKSQKVDYAQLDITTATAAKFVSDCQAQGYNPTWGVSEQAVGKDLLSVKDATFYGPAAAFPSVLDTPAAKNFRDVMKKYAKDGNWAEGTGSFAWAGLEMLHKALSSTTGTVTPKSVTAALNSIKNEDLNGLLANKVTYTAGSPAKQEDNPCMFVVGIKDGKTIAPDGETPLCAK